MCWQQLERKKDIEKVCICVMRNTVSIHIEFRYTLLPFFPIRSRKCEIIAALLHKRITIEFWHFSRWVYEGGYRFSEQCDELCARVTYFMDQPSTSKCIEWWMRKRMWCKIIISIVCDFPNLGKSHKSRFSYIIDDDRKRERNMIGICDTPEIIVTIFPAIIGS
mgnify:CR=1 FL=1